LPALQMLRIRLFGLAKRQLLRTLCAIAKIWENPLQGTLQNIKDLYNKEI